MWHIRFAESAAKELRKLDPPVARRIVQFLEERIAPSSNPRQQGTALRGSELGELWRYRLRNYRVIVRIEDEQVTVLVVKLGHRRDVYK